MASTLALFWLRRFVLVFVLVASGLLLVDAVSTGMLRSEGVVDAGRWAGIAGALAATINTHAFYRRGCRLPDR